MHTQIPFYYLFFEERYKVHTSPCSVYELRSELWHLAVRWGLARLCQLSLLWRLVKLWCLGLVLAHFCSAIVLPDTFLARGTQVSQRYAGFGKKYSLHSHRDCCMLPHYFSLMKANNRIIDKKKNIAMVIQSNLQQSFTLTLESW